MPSTFYTASPGWHWLVILYLFVGGLAGGCYFLGVLIDFFGRPSDRPLARVAYYVAFPATVISAILLTADLGKPLRFWHMLLQSERWVPMWKAWSPMSIGSWALLALGFFSLVSFLAALSDRGRAPAGLQALRPPHVLGSIVAMVGGILAFFVAGYTGVLLSVTNRPIWSDTNLLGLMFLLSAASTSAAVLVLLAHGRPGSEPGVQALERLDGWILVLEIVVLIALVVSLGGLMRLWLNAWGLLLVVGVVGIGMIVPLVLKWRPWMVSRLAASTASVLVLIGGFLLRVVIVLSAQGV
jgi:formate-dependent nitrite reductase membrane component NrfD